VDTTLTDLTDDRNLVDAEHELTRAESAFQQGGGHAPLLAWARKWGRPALIALQDLQEQVEPDDLRLGDD
jgi:hypothetical protein